ncbi:MAG: malto-oligosyltrehalose trehalohydrolase [Dehalococcoidia bacterium]
MAADPTLASATPSLPLGATVVKNGTTFRVWAPVAERVEVELYLPGGSRRMPLLPEANNGGCWAAALADVAAGARYKYRIDGGEPFPDPCSRFQPEGVHGPSAVVDLAAFAWSDAGWPGLSTDGLVIYELHAGTFTAEGTFDAAIGRLDYLRDLGVSAIELMPVADFPGERSWGYDGVALYAPSRAYGGPTGLQRLVDAAHARGLGVILDVVYNHLGPDGNYLRLFSPCYFTDRYTTPWGEALNYDGEQARPVREFVLQNAEQWLRDYHIDGLRLDAVDTIHDASEPHLLQELTARARAAAAPRQVLLIAESEANDVRLVAPAERGGYGLDAVWADDFHHAVHTALTGEHEGYYEDYAGRMDAIAMAIRDGFLYQGQPSRHLGRNRGTHVTKEPAAAFVFCLQNHDQVGNRARGERLNQLVGHDLYRVATTLLLFAPETPLLFMGEEFAVSSPFQYFTDHNPKLGRLVTAGRREEFKHFSAFHDQAQRSDIPDPQAVDTFARSRIDWRDAERHAGILRLHRDLLRLRRTDRVLQRNDRLQTEAFALGGRAIAVVRRNGDAVRLLLANLGDELAIDTAALRLAGLAGQTWRPLLATNSLAYRLASEPETAATPGTDAAGLPERLPARTAIVLAGAAPVYT